MRRNETTDESREVDVRSDRENTSDRSSTGATRSAARSTSPTTPRAPSDERWRARRTGSRGRTWWRSAARSDAPEAPRATSGPWRRTCPRTAKPVNDALRSYRGLKVEPHRATSEVVAGAYPFLAESGLGSEGVLIGQDAWSGAGFVYDPWVLYRLGVLTNPNCLLAGVVGRGKSTLAKSLATRSIAFGRRCYVPGDPKGEWSAVGAQRRRPGHRARWHVGATQPPRRGTATGVTDRSRRDSVTGYPTRRGMTWCANAGATCCARSLKRRSDEPMAPVESTALFSALDEAVRVNYCGDAAPRGGGHVRSIG